MMRSLDLNAHGMTELNEQEIKDANGGGWFWPAVLFQVAMELFDGSFFSDIEKGRKEAREVLGK